MSGELLGTSVLVLRVDQAPLTAGLSGAKRSTEQAGAAMQASMDKRMVSLGASMSKTGSMLTRNVTLPMIGGGLAAAKFAADFESALTQVRTQAGASAAEISNMRDAILKLAPAVGQTPVALADALYHIESAGLRGAGALDVLAASAKLAAIGHSDLESTSSAVVAVMKSAPKDVGNATDAIGLMNAIVGQGNMRLQDMVGALSTGILPAAKSAGLGLRDVGAALDVMTSRGVPAQTAATRLQMTISLMSAPTSKAAAALKSVGLSSTSLALDMRKPDGLVVAVRDLKTHMDAAGLSAVKQNALIAAAFGGGRSSSAIKLLLQSVGDLQTKFEGIGAHSGAAEVATAWRGTKTDMQQQFNEMKASAQVAVIEIGRSVGPELLKVGGEIAKDVGAVAHAFGQLPKGAQDMIIKGGLLLAGIGPALKLLGLFTGGVGKLWEIATIAGRLTGLGGGLVAKGAIPVAAGGEALGGRAAAVSGLTSVASIAAIGLAISLGLEKALNKPVKVTGGGTAQQTAAALTAKGTPSWALPTLMVNLNHQGAFTPAALIQGGKDAAKALEKGWNSYKFMSQPVMFSDFVKRAKDLSPQAQAAAGQAVIAYTRGLERSGRLPAGATALMIRQMMQQFPGMQAQMGLNARASVATFTAALDFTKTEANTKRSMNSISNDFQSVRLTLDMTKGDTITKANAVVAALLGIQKNGSGPMRAQATRDLSELRKNVETDMSATARLVESKASDMRNSIADHTAGAAAAGIGNFNQFETQVLRAVAGGAIGINKGMQLITDALNATLSAFGAAKVTVVQVRQLGADTLLTGSLSAAAAGLTGNPKTTYAGGGLIQIGRAGARGRDRIPMNVGGQPIVVGDGEQVAVLNHSQQAYLNWKLAADGGLPGMFRRLRRPHFMAGGGIVTASTFGGPGDPGTGSTGYRGDNLYQHPDSFAELNMGTALGSLPYMAPVDVTFGANTERVYKRDIGRGGPGIGGRSRAIDLWFQAANAIGLNGLANVTVNGGAGANVTIAGGGGGGGGTWKDILAPEVVGGGTMGALTNAMLGKVVAAANAYGRAHMPAPAAGGGGSGSAPGTVIAAPGSPQSSVEAAMMAAASQIIGRPYVWGGGHGSFSASGYDCSGAVSYILHAAGLLDAPETTDGLQNWGLPGGGKYITVGVRGTTGANAHTMMSFFGKFLESGGGGPQGGGGVHWDSGWDGYFPISRHPAGFASGGFVGDPGEVDPAVLLKSRPGLAGDPKFHAYLNARARTAPSPTAGGPVPRFAAGGFVPAVKKSVKLPPAPRSSGGAGLPSARQLALAGTPQIDDLWSGLGSLLNTQVPVLQDRYQYTSAIDDAQTFTYVVTPPTDVNGEQPASYVDHAAVGARLGQLMALYSWQTSIRDDLLFSLAMISQLQVRIRNAVAVRKAEIDRLRQVVTKNLAQIKSLGKHMPKDAKGKKAVNATISALQDVNARLAGDRAKIGTGGELGARQTQITALQDHLTIALADRTTVQGVSGIGGLLGDTRFTVSALGKQIGDLSPSAMTTLLAGAPAVTVGAAAAAAAAAAGAQTASDDAARASALGGYKDQQNQILGQQLAVSQAQYKVLAGLPQFGGSFAFGGVVPGPSGAARMILAHGGETVTPQAASDRGIQVIVQDGAVDPNKIRVIANDEVQRVTRQLGRLAARSLPSRGGGRNSSH